MGLTSRFLSLFSILTAVMLTVASLTAEWVFEACMVTDASGNRISLFEAQRKGERLTREVQATLERVETKGKIADMVMSGEMSLIEGAAWFRSLSREPHAWHALVCPPPGPKEGEGWCRLLVDWIDTRTRYDRTASEADAVRQCLESELQTHLDRDGCIELPD